MANSYTVDQLAELREAALKRGLIDTYESDKIKKFHFILNMRELKLTQPRDENGQFTKVVTNEDLLKKLEEIKNGK